MNTSPCKSNCFSMHGTQSGNESGTRKTGQHVYKLGVSEVSCASSRTLCEIVIVVLCSSVVSCLCGRGCCCCCCCLHLFAYVFSVVSVLTY